MPTAIVDSITTQRFPGNAAELDNVAGLFECSIASGTLANGTEGDFAVWQTLVTSSVDAAPVRVRFDGSQDNLPAPHILSAWHAEVGWHRPISEVLGALPAAKQSDLVDAAPANLPEKQTTVDRDDEATLTPAFAELVAEIAHDIRSPIAVAKQIVEAVAQQARTTGGLSSGELELLDVASMRLLEANKWAEGILVGRCLEHGTPINIRRRFYPSQWRGVVEPLLRGIAARRRIELKWVGWDRSLPRLYLDENQLTRAVQNLVSNAIQASPFGSTVEIRVAMQNNVTQRLVLAIEDSGSGLERNLMKQLNSHSPARGEKSNLLGSGLGLSTCKSLVTALGGELHASHSPSGGTLVRISLPTDDPQSLLRSWLVRDMQARSLAGDDQPSVVQLFAIRSAGLNQQFVDTQLQQSANKSDFVYRVSNDRWLWFNIAPAESESGESPALAAALRRLRDMRSGTDSKSLCQAQLVYRVRGIVAEKSQQLHTRLTEVAHLLTTQIERLTGGRIPTVDDIGLNPGSIVFRTQEKNTTRQIRQDMPQRAIAPKMHNRPARSSDTSTSRVSSTDVRVDSSGSLPAPAAPKLETPSHGKMPELSMATAVATPMPLAAPASDMQLAMAAMPTTELARIEPEVLADAMTIQRAIAEVANLWQTDLSTLKSTHSPLTSEAAPK